MDCSYLAIPHVQQVLPYFLYCFVGEYLIRLKLEACANSRNRTILIDICFFSYPLLNIPLPGTIPTKIVVPYPIARPSTESNPTDNGSELPADAVVDNVLHLNNLTFEQPFPWASNDPLVYIQQIVLRTSVIPWKKELQLKDAYRAPLYEVFKLLEIVRNHEDEARYVRKQY